MNCVNGPLEQKVFCWLEDVTRNHEKESGLLKKEIP
jgi:hypothetical protein